MIHLKILAIIRYPIVCSKWMSSTDAVTQEHPACLSAEIRHIITANNRHHNMNDTLHSLHKEAKVREAVFVCWFV